MTARDDIEATIGKLLPKFNTEYDILFGLYARGKETPKPDVNVIVCEENSKDYSALHKNKFISDKSFL